MAAPRTAPERETDRGRGDRRAPFSENPIVGARGQRTRQRILDAALRVFGDEGYHRASIDRIAKLSGCSRVSFYQYFASKEDVFQDLAGQVARQVSALTESLDPLTPDASGWAAMRAWVARYADIRARYEPIFHAYETDDVLATVAARTGDEVVARIHARLTATTLPPRQRNPVIRLLLECLNHALGVAGVLRSVAPSDYPHARVEDAMTDVLHRTFFGLRADVNMHAPSGPPPRALEIAAATREMIGTVDDRLEPSGSRETVLTALLTSGRDVFVTRGYHNTHVDDLVTAAGVSHGAFYRYFGNKGELARVLTAHAIRGLGATLTEIPDLFAPETAAGAAGLRKWLRRYNTAHTNEAAMLRVWVDAAFQDPVLRVEYAPPLDWGRRRMSRYLRPRGFGDVDMDAVVVVALFGVFGTRHRPPAEVEAAARIIERGFLGR